jgi:hypothetical protein
VRAQDVLDALRADYCKRAEVIGGQSEWAMVEEFPAWVPERGTSHWSRGERRIDALLVRTYGGGSGFERLAIEIKVSRSDYRNETDEKRAPAEALAHRTAYAAPRGVIDPATLPPGWGLLLVDEPDERSDPWARRTTWSKKCVRRVPSHDLDGALAMMARKAHGLAEQLRHGDSEAAEAARMRTEITRLTGQLERATAATQRERGRRRDAEHLLRATKAQTCFFCDEALLPTYSIHRERWRHPTKALDAACVEIRVMARQLERERDTGSAYLATLPLPIESRAEREERLAGEAQEA